MSGHISAFPSAWVARFADLPLFPARSIVPEHDGDTAWLDHLIEAVLADPPTHLAVIPEDHLWRRTVEATGIDPDAMAWGDPAWILLNDWKFQR